MAKNNDHESQWPESQWIDERLQALDHSADFRPDREQAARRLRMRKTAAGKQVRRTWTAVGLAAVCLAPLAFPAPRSFAQKVLNLVLRVEVAEVRQPAPDFTLSDGDGKAVKLSDYRGKVVLLNFWATWCSPCKREIPWFMEFEQNYKDRGFAVLGVSMDEDGWDAVRPYIAEQKVNYPVMIGKPGQLPELYSKIGALPATFLIDREGRIAGRHDSLATRVVYEEWIRRLLDN